MLGTILEQRHRWFVESGKENNEAFPNPLLLVLCSNKTPVGGGHVLFPLTTHEDAANGGLSYGLLYETTDGLSWVKRGMIGRFCSDIDVLPLESTDAAARSSLIATARYQTSGSTKQC